MTDIAAHLPWLAGVLLALLAYVVLHYLTGQPAVSPDAVISGSRPEQSSAGVLAEVFQYVLPACLLLASFISLLRLIQSRDIPVELPPDPLLLMTDEEFDRLVAEGFRREGYLAVERANKGTGINVDLELFMGRERYLVQCRRWQETKVGVATVRELYMAISSERAVGGFIVTSGKFTDEARKFALGRSIRLVPTDSLRRLFKKSGSAGGGAITISPVFSRRQKDPVPPACPKCGKAMMRRKSKQGGAIGRSFWSCTSFPACLGSRGGHDSEQHGEALSSQ